MRDGTVYVGVKTKDTRGTYTVTPPSQGTYTSGTEVSTGSDEPGISPSPDIKRRVRELSEHPLPPRSISGFHRGPQYENRGSVTNIL